MSESGSKLAIGIGAWLVVAGLAALTGYWIYLILSEPEVPVLVKVAVPVCVAGSVIVLGATLIQRMKRRKHEGLEEVEY